MNFKKYLKIFIILDIIIITIIFIIFFANFYIIQFSSNYIFSDIKSIQNKPVWLVLWASIKANSKPSDILADRLKTASNTYRENKIEKIIVSWDNKTLDYNEPEVMETYLISLWVKKQDIFKDYAWFDTYDSIYRANHIFWVKKLVIFTQEYHLYRAVYIANRLWIDSVWIKSDLHEYVWINKFIFREIFARIKAILEVDILKSETKYDKDIKIEIK